QFRSPVRSVFTDHHVIALTSFEGNSHELAVTVGHRSPGSVFRRCMGFPIDTVGTGHHTVCSILRNCNEFPIAKGDILPSVVLRNGPCSPAHPIRTGHYPVCAPIGDRYEQAISI